MDFAAFNLHFTYLRTKIVDKLGLSYCSTQELNGLIDTELPGRPHFQCETLDIGGEELEFHYRDVLECIRSLYGDPSWAQEMAFTPERHYTGHAHTSRVYNKLYTSDWWWTVQVCLVISRQNNVLMSLISGTLRGTPTRGYSCTRNCILGQDSTHAVQKQNSIPDLSYDR